MKYERINHFRQISSWNWMQTRSINLMINLTSISYSNKNLTIWKWFLFAITWKNIISFLLIIELSTSQFNNHLIISKWSIISKKIIFFKKLNYHWAKKIAFEKLYAFVLCILFFFCLIFFCSFRTRNSYSQIKKKVLQQCQKLNI